jgi:hypothetical protein
MAYSGTIGTTTFSARKVIDHAYRRCGFPAQSITAEMQDVALDCLHTQLSELANIKTPSWCIEALVLPMYESQPVVTLPVGTVGVLNLNYRSIQPVTGTETVAALSVTTEFATATSVSTVGLNWSGASPALVTFAVSDDGVTWTTVGTSETSATAGEITWTDISGALPYLYFRVSAATALTLDSVVLGNSPNEIPLGVLNRDTYVNQNNKTFPGRPNSYWFQRDLPVPVVNLWPAPNLAAEAAQLVVWRHRQIMDTNNLTQEIEVPQRWLEAVIAGLADKVALETPGVEPARLGSLPQRAASALMIAFDGDNDGSPTFYQPNIGVYTR